MPALSAPDVVHEFFVVGCAHSWPNSDSELVLNNSMSSLSLEQSPARAAAVASLYFQSTTSL